MGRKVYIAADSQTEDGGTTNSDCVHTRQNEVSLGSSCDASNHQSDALSLLRFMCCLASGIIHTMLDNTMVDHIRHYDSFITRMLSFFSESLCCCKQLEKAKQ